MKEPIDGMGDTNAPAPYSVPLVRHLPIHGRWNSSRATMGCQDDAVSSFSHK
jgi:hypothetical protein